MTEIIKFHMHACAMHHFSSCTTSSEATSSMCKVPSVSSQPGAHNGPQQDGALPSHNPLGIRPLELNTVMPGLLPLGLLLVAQPQSNPSNPLLPLLPQKLKNKILKREYIDFTDLLSSNMYPVHTPSSDCKMVNLPRLQSSPLLET